MQDAIKIHPQDNVAVALQDIDIGTSIALADHPVTLRQAVERGISLPYARWRKAKRS